MADRMWHDVDSALLEWADASALENDKLVELLEVAREQVVAYAPKVADDSLAADSVVVPIRYRLAQLRQAENIWNAGAVNANGSSGDGDTFALSPKPLDWHVKNLIRPKRGTPRVR